MLAALSIVALIGAGASAQALWGRPACARVIVEGNLDGDASFTTRDVILYGSGVFPGNPMVVHVAGNITAAGWYSVRLPGARALDELRVVGTGAQVGAYFMEDGSLHFYAALDSGSAAGVVDIFYVAGSASWTAHFELDFDAAKLALIARIDWPATTMFRHVDLLLVSGKLHAPSPSSYQGRAPAASAGSSTFGPSSPPSSLATDSLAAFEVPSSTDAGIYVVHRARGVDIPGSNSNGVRTCAPAGFYLRVYESPVEATQVVAVEDAAVDQVAGDSTLAGANGTGAPLEIELRNTGDLPWMGGRTDIYKDGILAGADNLPYVPRNGTARIEMGWALDLRVTRSVEIDNGTRYQNYTVQNFDVSPYAVEIKTAYAGTVSDPGPFVRGEAGLTVRVEVAATSRTTIGFAGPA
jgi:hypothetical protein